MPYNIKKCTQMEELCLPILINKVSGILLDNSLEV